MSQALDLPNLVPASVAELTRFERVALTRVQNILKVLHASYVIVLPNGMKIGDLDFAPPRTRSERRNSFNVHHAPFPLLDRRSANARAQQRQRLLAALEVGPVSTLDAREQLDVIHPAARVLELRERGYRILTTWVRQSDASGRAHRVALYVLLSVEDARP